MQRCTKTASVFMERAGAAGSPQAHRSIAKPVILQHHAIGTKSAATSHTFCSKRLAVASALSSASRFQRRLSMVMGRGVSGGTTMRRAYRLRRSSGRPARSHSMARAWLLLCVWGIPCQAHCNCHACHIPERRTEILISMHTVTPEIPKEMKITKSQPFDNKQSSAGKGRRLEIGNSQVTSSKSEAAACLKRKKHCSAHLCKLQRGAGVGGVAALAKELQ